MSSIATTPLMPPRKINDSKHWRDRARLGYAALGPAGKHSNFKLLRAVRYDGRARAKTFDRTNAFGSRKRWNAKTLRSPRGIENDGWVGSTTLASRARVGCYNCRCVAVLLCSRSTASGWIEELNVCFGTFGITSGFLFPRHLDCRAITPGRRFALCPCRKLLVYRGPPS
jgi:hypothetical protein